MSKRVAVVGAGIVGLSAASALRQAGAEVRCFEKDAPGQAQSVGLTRIFRYAHGEARLVRLAMRAREGWQAWERRWGRRLVGQEGLVVVGAALTRAWQQALHEAGAPYERLTAAQARALLPISRPPDDGALWDPSAGATRVRRTIDALCADVSGCLVPAEVLDVSVTSAGMRVRTPVDTWECDEVVVAAGIDTPRLAAQVGLSLPAELVYASRFTFTVRDPQPRRPPACWIDDSGAYGAGVSSYGQPVGSTGQYAVGVEPGDEGYAGALDAADVSRQSMAVTHRYVQAALPGLDPEPVAEVQCLHVKIGNADGDGFGAVRREAATFVYGNNLFKFAPLLGELLCRAALDAEVPADLRSAVSPRSA